MNAAHKRTGSCAGLTLTELLITVMLFGMMSGMMVSLTYASRAMFDWTDTRAAASTDSQRVFDHLQGDLSAAHRTSLTCATDQVSFNPLNGGARITYARDGQGNLVRTQDNHSQIVMSGLVSFNPRCPVDGPTTVGVTTHATTAHDPSVKTTIDTQVWIRNP